MIDIIKNQKILESNHLYSDLAKVEFSLMVMRDSCVITMNFAIQLDCEPLGIAVKIEYVRSNAVLPAKLSSSKFGILDIDPKGRFGRC